MIPNISQAGSSFRGAGRYYLHDKAADRSLPGRLKPSTDDRVAWSDTRNLANFDPELALDEMWRTAESQAYLKRQAGVRAGGRTCEDPVKTISLSWHPSETPTPEQMIAAADSYLRHMGWSEHQAVYIGHSDTAHPHMHIILNRVHPETGRTLDDYKDRKRSQQWALAYEREQGRIWCEKRLETENNRQRAANENLPHNVIELTRPLERQFMGEEARREAADQVERDLLKAQQRAEREAFFAAGARLFKSLRHEVFAEVREEYRPQWADYYKDKREAEKDARLGADAAMALAFRNARDGDWGAAWQHFDHGNDGPAAIAQAFAERARELRQAQLDETRARQQLACDALREAREAAYLDLKRRQQEERTLMRAAHAQGERAAWLVDLSHSPARANDNREPRVVAPPAAANLDRAAGHAAARSQADPASAPRIETNLPVPRELSRDDRGTEIEIPQPAMDGRSHAPVPHRGAADLAAGGIGSLAAYLADQMAEMLAPTPPEVREARAKEQARREAEKPVVELKDQNPYARHAEAAIKKAEADREHKRDRDYWDDRERRRER